MRQLRYGLQLPSLLTAPYRRPRPYPMVPKAVAFVEDQVARWLVKGFVRRAMPLESQTLIRAWNAYPSFVTESAAKLRLVIEFQRVIACLEP